MYLTRRVASVLTLEILFVLCQPTLIRKLDNVYLVLMDVLRVQILLFALAACLIIIWGWTNLMWLKIAPIWAAQSIPEWIKKVILVYLAPQVVSIVSMMVHAPSVTLQVISSGTNASQPVPQVPSRASSQPSIHPLSPSTQQHPQSFHSLAHLWSQQWL